MLLFLFFTHVSTAQIFMTINGHADFLSEAPLEIIKASTEQLQGVLDKNNKTFAFKMYIKSFDGFNNPLQKVHFFENYMEVRQFPLATFKGKILEELDSTRGVYRAKGMLSIHGVEEERIIEVSLNIEKETIEFEANFSVPLVDFNIDLPRIVYQKIAQVIRVNVHGIMKIKE
jgi:polyisoprenoid-binding protein YceI